MNVRRVVVVLTILALLAVGAVKPKPARADAQQIAIIAGVAVAAWFVIVVIGAAVVYHKGPFALAPIDPETAYAPPQNGVRPGTRCSQRSGNVTLACW
jgi:hypothetical protein